MTQRHLLFLALVPVFMLIEGLVFYLVLRLFPNAANPRSVLLLAAIFFLCIPLNIVFAWLIVLRGKKG